MTEWAVLATAVFLANVVNALGEKRFALGGPSAGVAPGAEPGLARLAASNIPKFDMVNTLAAIRQTAAKTSLRRFRFMASLP